MKSQRHLLIVTEPGATYSNLKRAFAYSRFFAGHPQWSVEYVDRNAPPSPARAFIGKVARRVMRRLGVAPRRRPAHRLSSRDRAILERARTADVVYFLKTPAPDLQTRIIKLGGPRVVLDVNDALWLPYHRRVGFDRLEEVLVAAHGIICENPLVAGHVRQYNARVEVVPDCVRLDIFDAQRDRVVRDPAKVRLGWIGSPANGGFLYAIWEPLEKLFARHPHLELRVVGAGAPHLPHFEKVRWSSTLAYDHAEMAREALAMDIGLYPLFHVEDSLARGTAKAVIYMAAGAVAVCENIGENARLIRDGVNGVLAHGPDEWLAKLDWLVTHPDERRRIGAAGLETIRTELPDRVCFERLVAALNTFVDAK
jgi:glycosyltransferase involved in cell wall biosynthesis